jgi:hypothetical protein
VDLIDPKGEAKSRLRPGRPAFTSAGLLPTKAGGAQMKFSWICLLGLSLSAVGAGGQGMQATWGFRPYRALLVVERWSDPASVLVDHEKDDFQPIAALLKA